LGPIRERGRENSSLREKFDRGAFSGFSYKLVRQGWPDRVDSARRVRS
jgi:hypothetical protein